MTASSPAETYAAILINRLSGLYGEYVKELQQIQKGLADSSVEILENFINIEQHRFQKISSTEKVLNTHLQGCTPLFRSRADRTLNPLRMSALEQSRSVRASLKERMVRIKAELSSLRKPGRAKNYRQESVPVLIDIER